MFGKLFKSPQVPEIKIQGYRFRVYKVDKGLRQWYQVKVHIWWFIWSWVDEDSILDLYTRPAEIEREKDIIPFLKRKIIKWEWKPPIKTYSIIKINDQK